MTYTVTAFLDNAKKDFSIEADSPREATTKTIDKYGESRLLVVRVKAQKSLEISFFDKVKPRDLEFFCRQFYALLSAGVTPMEALSTIGQETAEKKFFSDALQAVADSVRDGKSLSSSFKLRPKVFPMLLCNMVAAAEESGSLDQTMDMLAKYYAKQSAFTDKIKSAISYPSLVAGMALLEIFFLFTFVVPRFTSILTSANIPLPKITLFVLAFSSHAYIIFPGVFFVILATIFAFKRLTKNEDIKCVFERLLMKIPLIGKLIVMSAASYTCRTMSLMTAVGVQAMQMLSLTEKIAGFATMKRDIRSAQDKIRNGQTIRDAFNGSKWFPPIALKMISVGESSGKLDVMLGYAAETFESQLDVLMEKLPTFAEVVLMVLIGGVVLVVLLSIYLPIFSMYKAIGS